MSARKVASFVSAIVPDTGVGKGPAHLAVSLVATLWPAPGGEGLARARLGGVGQAHGERAVRRGADPDVTRHVEVQLRRDVAAPIDAHQAQLIPCASRKLRYSSTAWAPVCISARCTVQIVALRRTIQPSP